MTHFDPGMTLHRRAGAACPEAVLQAGPLPVFDDAVLAMLADLSRQLMAPDMRAFPAVVSLGFFCRPGHLNRLATEARAQDVYRLGRGVSLHYAPSNVPLNFCYSLIAGLLSGNSCLIRLSDKASVEADKVLDALDRVLSAQEHHPIRDRLFLFQAPHGEGLNKALAGVCDVRVIWGGDATVTTIRKAPLKPQAFDVTFADRYSICLVASQAYLEESEAGRVAAAFFNDTFVFDQNACSSPKAVFWVGPKDVTLKAKTRFWTVLHDLMAEREYRCPEGAAATKLMTVASLAVDGHQPELEICRKTGNFVVQAAPEQLCDPTYVTGSGFFLQADVDQLSDLPDMRHPKLQTVTYFGFDGAELAPLLVQPSLKIRADRVVKMGTATAFELVWDGYDLISHMSRRVAIH